MKKNIIIDYNARKEFDQFSEDIRDGFSAYVETLEKEGRLDFPDARKVTSNIFEIRVQYEGAYRGFYAYAQHPDIVILHFFQKKTQKTPLKNIKTAIHRLRNYKQ